MNKFKLFFLCTVSFALSFSVEASLKKVNEPISATVQQHSCTQHPLENQLQTIVKNIQTSTTLPKLQKLRFQNLFVQCALDMKIYIHKINLMHPNELNMRVPQAIIEYYKHFKQKYPDFEIQKNPFLHNSESNQVKTSDENIIHTIKLSEIYKECNDILKEHPFLLYNHEKLTNHFKYIVDNLKNKNESIRMYAQCIYAELSTLYCTTLTNVFLMLPQKILLLPREKELSKCINKIHEVLTPERSTGSFIEKIDGCQIPFIELINGTYQFKQWVKDAYKSFYNDLSTNNKKITFNYSNEDFKNHTNFEQHKELYIPTTLDGSYTIEDPSFIYQKNNPKNDSPPLYLKKKKKTTKIKDQKNKSKMPVTCSSAYVLPESKDAVLSENEEDEDADNEKSTSSSSSLTTPSPTPQRIIELWHQRIHDWNHYKDQTDPLSCVALKRQGYLGTDAFKSNLMHEYTKIYGSEIEAARNIINNHLFPKTISIYIFNTMTPTTETNGSYSFSVPAFRLNKKTNHYDYGFIEINYTINSDTLSKIYTVFHRFFRIVQKHIFEKEYNIKDLTKKQELNDHEYALALDRSEKTGSSLLKTIDDSTFQMVGETDSAWKIDDTTSDLWTYITHENPQKDMDFFEYGILKLSI